MVSDIQIRQRPMYVGANFLPSLRCSKDSNDRDLIGWGLLLLVGRNREGGVKWRGVRLVVVDAVESDAKTVHEGAPSGFLTSMMRSRSTSE